MNLNYRFAIASDLHIGLPQTIQHHSQRFHLVEVSIPALEKVLDHLGRLDLDFLLLPGDLTQDGEAENHQWLVDRLARLPYPVYVVPGNHDVPYPTTQNQVMGLAEFPQSYQKFGYNNSDQCYYSHEILPGLQLIGLNSNLFDQGQQIGRLSEEQLIWLEQVLAEVEGDLVMVMIHHNVIEHLPGQATNPLGKRYMLENATELLSILKRAGVKLIFTGHLYVQDIAQWQDIYEITTGSLVSYPHPYRIVDLTLNTNSSATVNSGRNQSETSPTIAARNTTPRNITVQDIKVQGITVQNIQLEIASHCVMAVPGWPDLSGVSRQWLGDRSFPFMMKLLTLPPLEMPVEQAKKLAPDLQNFWADIAAGDGKFDFPNFPEPVRGYFQKFSAGEPIDNHAVLTIDLNRS